MLPVPLYSCKSWSTTEALNKKLRCFRHVVLQEDPVFPTQTICGNLTKLSESIDWISFGNLYMLPKLRTTRKPCGPPWTSPWEIGEGHVVNLRLFGLGMGKEVAELNFEHARSPGTEKSGFTFWHSHFQLSSLPQTKGKIWDHTNTLFNVYLMFYTEPNCRAGSLYSSW